MTEPERQHLKGVPDKREVHGLDDVAPGLRVHSSDYGSGTVLADLGIGIQIYWDRALPGTVDSHMLTHDKAYVARLERL